MIMKKIAVSLIATSVLFTACGGGGDGGTSSGTIHNTDNPNKSDTSKPSLKAPFGANSSYKVISGQRKFITLSTGENLITKDGKSIYKFNIENDGGANVEFDDRNYGFLTYTATDVVGAKDVVVSVSKNGVKSDPITLKFETTPSIPAQSNTAIILKTGQVSGTDDFANERAFTETTDGKHNIVDPTGLTWADSDQFTRTTNYDYGTAGDKCSRLGTGWRLPSADELLNLIDYGKAYGVTEPLNPMTQDIFKTKLAYSWAVKEDGVNMFVSNTAGINSANNVEVMQYRCVNGDNQAYNHVVVTDAIGDTYDLSTGIQWSKVPQTDVSAVEAEEYCSSHQNTNGHNDWRLPTINELRSIIEKGGVSAGIVDGKLSLVSSTTTVNKGVSYNYGLILNWNRKKPIVGLFPQNGEKPQKSGVSCVRVYSDNDISKLK